MEKKVSLNNIQNILLVRTDRIGDVILTTPVIPLLKENHPNSRIFFLTTNYTAPLLKYQRSLHDILIYHPESIHKGLLGCITLSKELKQKNIDIAFLFYPTPELALSLRLAKIPIRVGIGYRWYSFLVNHRIFQHRKHGLKHELEYNIFLLKDFIKEIPPPSKINFNFSINESLERKKSKILKKIKISKPYVIFHPGSGGSAPNLPPHKYAKIADYLIENIDVDLLLVGDKKEYRLLKYIAEKITKNKNVHLISGDWDLEEYTAMIAFCNLFLSNSTGPLHIARALNIPLLAFYCPALPYTPKRWGPYNQIDSVLSPKIDYPPRCSTKHCPYQNCMDQIEWSIIKNKIDLILQMLN